MLGRRSAPPLSREEFLDLVRFLMEMDATLEAILEEMGIDRGED